jgi:hypothetical protein
LPGLKSELLCELHYDNKCLLLFLLVVFLAVSSLEFPTKRFPVICARETLINEGDSQEIEISEGVHSLGWIGQEEER